ncbi:MAG: hypothetical protein NT121_12345 [Chloroflexi bacterium]|nr:hypothetical protein [Chloroflexota bacterium]
MTTFIVNIIGWAGVVLLLLAYALVSLRRLDGDSVAFQLLNMAGALLLIINSFYFGAYPSVGVNLAWIFIAIFTLGNTWRKRA